MRGVRFAEPGQKVVLPSASLRGSNVIDPQGEPLGRIDDVVLSHGTGPISYVVLEPGTKDRLIPIPFGAFRVTTNGRLVLDIDQGRIYTAPSYPKGGRPNWSDRVWDQRVASFWGCMPRGVTKEQAEQQSSSSPSTGRRH
jgi:sporulation protein YlmC with PRC-barrel domain